MTLLSAILGRCLFCGCIPTFVCRYWRKSWFVIIYEVLGLVGNEWMNFLISHFTLIVVPSQCCFNNRWYRGIYFVVGQTFLCRFLLKIHFLCCQMSCSSSWKRVMTFSHRILMMWSQLVYVCVGYEIVWDAKLFCDWLNVFFDRPNLL